MALLPLGHSNVSDLVREELGNFFNIIDNLFVVYSVKVKSPYYLNFPAPRQILIPWIVAGLAALLYTWILWQIPFEGIKDRGNYLSYPRRSEIILYRLGQGTVVHLFANEPLWLWVNSIGYQLISSDSIVRFVIAVGSFPTALVVLRQRIEAKHFWFLVFILFFIPVLKNYIVHLRQGMAIGVFLAFWAIGNRKWTAVGLGVAALIHASFFVVGVVWLVAWFFSTLKARTFTRLALYAGLGVLLSLSLGQIASFLGARQAAALEGEVVLNISGLGFLFWLFIFSGFLWTGISFVRKHSFEIGMLVFYLSNYFITPFSARILESAIVPILLMVPKTNPKARVWLFAAFAFYMTWNIIQRSQIQNFGF